MTARIETHPHPDGVLPTGPDTAAVAEALARTAGKIAPLWPLQQFVAVNPFLGLADRDFGTAARTLTQACGGRMTMPRAFYADAIAAGRITDADLVHALAAAAPGTAGVPGTVAGLKKAAASPAPASAAGLTPTVADQAADVHGTDWPRFVVDRISHWAAGYFDQGQALWPSPWRGLSPYAAWRAQASLDRTPELMGLPGFRAIVGALPEAADEAAALAVQRLGIPAAGLDAYLHRLMLSIGGWSAYARYQVWQSALLHGQSDATLTELLTIRLVWDYAVFEALADGPLADAWAAARTELAAPLAAPATEALALELVLHDAYEAACQRDLLAALKGAGAPSTAEPQAAERPAVQAAFCIDVRSEVFRRALEAEGPAVETIGFAGFFGLPIEVVRHGEAQATAHCPVLLKPQRRVAETVRGADAAEQSHIGARQAARRRLAAAWKAFKRSAVPSFAFVETLGLGFLGRLVRDGLGFTEPSGRRVGLTAATTARLAPALAPDHQHGQPTGLPASVRLEMAASILRGMSLTDGFARLVALVGHGGSSVNNPHAAGLHCGACGGQTGEVNARLAAAILNDPEVRAGLAGQGLAIPDDTVFLGCLHDTTTDAVTVYDQDLVPASHAADLAWLQAGLARAGKRARAERAALLNLEPGRDRDAAIVARSHDWSQVRPEWGLAGCAAFIAAPRHRTRGQSLAGRSFLHSYDWHQDQDFRVLELIMTAPMVVASWISLQYYASTVDNDVFGSGNKVLHNVTGLLGVLEGNGGDLRVGLPWQSVHDGSRLVHEPVRLSVLIEAPVSALTGVIARHAQVRQLLDNGWLHLFALDEQGAVAHRYAGNLTWTPMEGAVGARLAA